MRSVLLKLIISTLISVSLAAPEAQITAAPQVRNELRQMSRAELKARHDHPELFGLVKRQQVVSYATTTCATYSDATTTTYGPSTGYVTTTVYPEPTPRKRQLETVRHVLGADEIASFLIGGGRFAYDNGTTYVDEAWEKQLAYYASPSLWGRTNRYVKNALGSVLLPITIPHYKTWKRSLKEEELFRFTAQTAIKAKDITELEQSLLARPDFAEIQFLGVKVDRKFLEVATSF